ncbi:hypothetical protein PISL3812_03184 [Talaromyces islandicus]|uniref:Uncharacterized protein n=1 Tax=Talaromyces islandicus TaxID=28573 RepID=A0A0U1LU71_TALIS|nr:hypothetical protein PISL3812_03184 [Talaromyces islandicus]
MSTVTSRDASTNEKDIKEPKLAVHLIQGYETAEQRQRRWEKYGLWAGIVMTLVSFVTILYMLNLMFRRRSVYKPPEFSSPFPISSPATNIETWEPLTTFASDGETEWLIGS